MRIPLYQVDSFSSRLFSGNPAAVCILEKEIPEPLMQKIANEMNLSETAFVSRTQRGHWRLRWFTPTTEVPLCGHATLAAAHVLWERGDAHVGFPLTFKTKSGELQAIANNERISLNFPSLTVQDSPENIPSLEKALGLTVIGAATVETQDDPNWIAEISSEDLIRLHKPDFSAIAALKIHGVIITAKGSSSPYDIVSRYYAPNLGIPEDPVTGFAHCCLAPYWANKLGKTQFKAYQASKRGGEILVEMQGDRVILEGEATTVFQTELILSSNDLLECHALDVSAHIS